LRKIQLPAIGGVRKVIKPGTDTVPGTTIAELGNGTISLAQLATILTQIQKQQVNTGGGNIGDGTEAVLVPGPGLSGGGPMLGTVGIRLTAPIPWGLEDSSGGGDGDPGPPGPPGRNGITGQQGAAGPAAFMSADDGADGDIGPPGLTGITGTAGPSGTVGAAGPPGTTLVFSNTTVPAGNTVANTSIETFFTSAYAIPPSTMAVGMVIRVKLFGVYSTGVVAPSLAMRIYFGSTVMVASGTLTTVAGVTNDGWSAEGIFIVQTIGAVGAIEAQGLSEFSTASTAVLFVNMDNTAPITVNTTISQTVQVSVQWGGTVNASDTITLREMTVEVMSASGVASPPPPPPFSVFFADDGEDGMMGPPGIAGAAGTGGTTAIAVPGLINDLVFWWQADQAKNSIVGAKLFQMANSCPWLPAYVTNAITPATLSGTALNGLNAYTWAASATYAFSSANISPILTRTTIFVVFNPAQLTANAVFIQGASGAFGFFIGTTGKLTTQLVGTGNIGADTTTLTVGTYFQANVIYNSTSGAWAYRVNRAAGASGTQIRPITAGSSNIGSDPSPASFLQGTLAEIIVYNRDLSGTEISNVENYLHTKWNV